MNPSDSHPAPAPATCQSSTIQHTREVPRKRLVNMLNYLNFQDGLIQVNLKHPRYDQTVTLSAHPEPCLGKQLECRWDASAELPAQIDSYSLTNFTISDSRQLLVKPQLLQLNDQGVSFILPHACQEIRVRRTKRHDCEQVKVQFLQNGAVFPGRLINFSLDSFQVELTTRPPQTFLWINGAETVTLSFTVGQETLYSGICRILKQTPNQTKRILVLTPISDQIRRFKPKIFRSTRNQLTPSPNIRFVHPLSGKLIELKITNISGSGFAVEERLDSAVLIPGLIIPQMKLVFPNQSTIPCRTQVIYSKLDQSDPEQNLLQCGLTILDMEISCHVQLMASLHQAHDPNSYLCNQIDPETLWKFFFESGFIYPHKYAEIQANKQGFKETYLKLYTQNPDIARHFIYQDKGAILGHMSMVRFHSNTWLIHHHAAAQSESKRTGLIVLNQAGRSLNDSQSLYSAHMNFVMCYFRPENRFPMRIFGGVAQHYQNPKECSIDPFSYSIFRQPEQGGTRPLPPWDVAEVVTQDLDELARYYEHVSGGLMLNALDLEAGSVDDHELSTRYRALGFSRSHARFSLKKEGVLKAIFLVSLSDIGLNMSSLTNCIKVIVLDPQDLPRQTLNQMLSFLLDSFNQQEMPVLLYPQSYAAHVGITSDKTYNLWVLNCHNLDPYFQFCERFTRRS